MTTAINPGVYMQERRKAILCLCYDRDMLQVRQMLLEHFGYQVLPTSSVEDAKTVAGDSCPDMLLMDSSHPGIDFEHVAEQVKRVCPTVLTVVLSPYYGVRPGPSGCVDRFVAKDDGPDILIAQIEELFQQRAGGQSRPTIM
jgi:CheY-like chemotaxis protein